MKLHHVAEGDGPTVVLVGSLGSTLAMWEPQLPALHGFRVVRVDLPGHGGSAVPDAPFSIEDVAAAVVEIAGGRASYCGVSLGGLVAMRIAAAADVDRLVLACTKPAFPPASQWVERAERVRREGMASIADAVLARWFAADVPAAYREMFLSVPAAGYARCCEALTDVDLTEDLGRIVAPTLAIGGSEDPTVTPADVAALPGAHAIIPRAAHLANAERPREFNALLREHLAA